VVFSHQINIVKRQDRGWAVELNGADPVENIIRRNTGDKENNT
jgi:hypothetical protein